MFTTSGGKTLGCLASAEESDWPVSTAVRTSPRVLARSLFSVCSERIASARSSERPLLIIVANCRLMTARSLNFTRFIPGMLISRSKPMPASRTVRGAYPMPRSRCTRAASLGASSLPLTSLPLRSRTEYSKVLVAVLMSAPLLSRVRRGG